MPAPSFQPERTPTVRLVASLAGDRSARSEVERDVREAFRLGDPDAVGYVYDAFAGSLMAVAVSILGDSDVAADVVQQTFIKAWKAADALDPSRPMGPWLRTIARRTALDSVRHAKHRSGPPLSAVPEPAAKPVAFDAALVAGEVRAALDRLPADERSVIQLVHLDGLSQAEVARALGIPLGTVKSRSSRAHKRLASWLRFLRDEGDSR